MRNAYRKTVFAGILLGALLLPGIVIAAPYFIKQPSVLPQGSGYDLGTSTAIWSRLYVDYASTTALSATTLCLASDCRSAWPSGGGGVWPFNPSTTYNTAVQATTTPAWYQNGLFASSTSYMATTSLIVLDNGGQVYNVRAYGAVCDGTTDDSTAINNTITLANTKGGGTVLVPCTDVAIASTINMKSAVTLAGRGASSNNVCATEFKWTGAAGDTMILVNGGGSTMAGANIKDICLDANSSAGYGVRTYSMSRSLYENITINNGFTVAGWLTESSGSGAGTGPQLNIFRNIQIIATGSADGFVIGSSTTAVNFNWNLFESLRITHVDGRGLVCGNADSNYFTNPFINGSGSGVSVILQDGNDTGTRNCRSNVFKNLQATGGISIDGTGTYPAVNNVTDINYESGTPAPVTTGVATYWGFHTNGNLRAGTSTLVGNVLMGTTTGVTPFEMYGSGSPVLTLTRSLSTQFAQIGLGLDALNSVGGRTEYARVESRIWSNTAGSEQGTLGFYTKTGGTSAEAMRISNTGQVGIGTTTPNSSIRFALGGNAWIGGNITATGTLNVLDAATLQSTLGIAGAITSTATTFNTLPYASTTALTVSGNGYFPGTSRWNSTGIGIGTTSPLRKLEIVGASGANASITNNSNDMLVLSNNGQAFIKMLGTGLSGLTFGSLGASGSNASLQYDFDNDYMRFTVTQSEKMRISPNGGIGMGTTSPQWGLTIASSTKPQLALADGSLTSDAWTFRNIANSLYIATSSFSATSSVAAMRIAPSGVVTFGNNAATCAALTGSADLCDGVDSGSVGGGAWPFTASTNFGVAVQATSTPIHDTAGIMASSTSYLMNTNFYGDINLISNSGWIKQDGVTLAYASSTNVSTIFGIGAGGQLATTSSGAFTTAFGMDALSRTTVASNSAFGYASLKFNTSGTFNVAAGWTALLNNTTGSLNTALGYAALDSNNTGNGNVAVGSNSLDRTTGSENTALGAGALQNNNAGGQNIAVGYNAGVSGVGAYWGNVFLGHETAFGGSGTFASTTMIGYRAGYNNVGSNNIFLGALAGDNVTTGTQNVMIGTDIDAPSATDSGQLNIQNIIYGRGNTGIGSTLSTGNIGIGTTTPFWKLTVASTTGPQLALVDGTNSSHAWTFRNIANTLYIATSSASATSSVAAMTINPNGLVTFGLNAATCAALTGSASLCDGDDATGAGGGAWPFTPSTYAGVANQSTTTPLYLPTTQLIASSTLATNATTTNMHITSITNSVLATDPNGRVIATSSIGVDKLTGTLPIAKGGTNATALGSHMLTSFNGTSLVSTSTPTAAAYLATSSTATSIFAGMINIGTTTSRLGMLTIGTSTAPQIVLSDNSGSSKPWTIRATGDMLYFATSTATATSTPAAMSMNGAGAAGLGVGTSSPWRTLSVVGSMAITGLSVSTAGNAVCILSNFEVVSAGGTTCVTSSRRFKHDISDLSNGMATVLAMRPHAYTRNQPSPSQPDGKEVGFIAEEVQQVEPRLVEYEPDGKTPRAVNYMAYTAILTKAIQEQQEQIDAMGGAARENWQWLLIGLLGAGLLAQQLQILRIKKLYES